MFSGPFHHLGIACEDLERGATFVQAAFEISSDSGPVYDPEQDATVQLFNAGSPSAIELVSGNAVKNIVRRGAFYYHVCYEVVDINASIARLSTMGGICARGPKPAILFDGRLVAFVLTPIGLVELLERE